MKSVKQTLTPLFVLALSGHGIFAGPAPVPGNKTPPVPPPPQEADSLEDLQAKMVEIHEQQESVRATADKEQRRLDEKELAQLEELADQFDALDDEVKARERMLAQKEKLTRPAPRKVPPTDLPEAGGRQRITGGEAVGATRNSWGFRSLGEFCKVVASGEARADPRIQAAATTYGNETTLADGGFAVPPDFRENIVKKVAGEDSLLSRTDQQFTSSDRITVPLDNTTPWQETGGIQVYWDNEAAAMTPSKPALEQLECKANRMTALVPVTEELMADAPSLTRYLPGKVADKFTSKINRAIIQGDGVAKPKGLLSSASKIAVDEETDQDADTILFANIAKMWSRLYAPLRAGAIWLINQDVEPQLYGMTVPGSQPAFPAYLPPGGLSGAMYGTLMGRPVIAQEFCKTVGTEGDVILTNLSSYLSVQKVGGLRSDVSIHLYFDQNIVAFRFVMRMGGQSWWSQPAERAEGNNTLSNIITIATRAG
jgi:HK97 family phage major capsid protein